MVIWYYKIDFSFFLEKFYMINFNVFDIYNLKV